MRVSTTIQVTPKTQQLTQNFAGVMRPVIVAGMELTAQAAEAEIVVNTPVDQGTLRASAFGRVIDQWPRITGVLGSPLTYAEPVEKGSRPHWPPRAPIQGWVHRKFGLSGKEMVRVAFFVARKIARVGTKGHFMFDKGLKKAEQVAPSFIGAGIRRVEQTLSDR